MHSTPIFLLAFGLLATIAMARPGSHHGQRPGGFHGDEWSVYRLPKVIRLPRLLAGKLEEPRRTFVAKKILDGKYLVISPALIFKYKNIDTESTTIAPGGSTQPPTTTQPDIETTTIDIDEESTTTAEPDIETTTEAIDEKETTTATPSFRKRSFSINNNEQLLFLDD